MNTNGLSKTSPVTNQPSMTDRQSPLLKSLSEALDFLRSRVQVTESYLGKGLESYVEQRNQVYRNMK